MFQLAKITNVSRMHHMIIIKNLWLLSVRSSHKWRPITTAHQQVTSSFAQTLL